MAIKKSNHCAYDTHYHIVFPVKYRKALLDKNITLAITKIAREIEQRYSIEFEKLGYDENHIHILTSFHPKYSGSQIVTMFKSITAKQLFKQFPELKKELWGGEFWSDGYYLATVSERGDWNSVRRYVENQGKAMQKPLQLKLIH